MVDSRTAAAAMAAAHEGKLETTGGWSNFRYIRLSRKWGTAASIGPRGIPVPQ